MIDSSSNFESSDSGPHWYGVIAVERQAATAMELQLSRQAADTLVTGLMAQVARHVPDGLGLAWSAALYDPAQLLRRGFPVHREVLDLARAGRAQGVAPGQALTVIAGPSGMPTALLQPDPKLGAGTLLVIPWVLWGDAAAVAAATQRLESELFEQGLADPAIVLALAELGETFEHARLMSIADLMAMMAAQLDQVGLAAAWQILEESLLAPTPREFDVQSRLGQAWRLTPEHAILSFEPISAYANRVPVDHIELMLGDYLERVHEFRQTQALLLAHGLDVTINPAPEGGLIVDYKSNGLARSAVLHEHPGLGALAFTLIDDRRHVLAHYYPVAPGAIGDFLASMRERGLELVRPGRVMLAIDGTDLCADA